MKQYLIPLILITLLLNASAITYVYPLEDQSFVDSFLNGILALGVMKTNDVESKIYVQGADNLKFTYNESFTGDPTGFRYSKVTAGYITIPYEKYSIQPDVILAREKALNQQENFILGEELLSPWGLRAVSWRTLMLDLWLSPINLFNPSAPLYGFAAPNDYGMLQIATRTEQPVSGSIDTQLTQAKPGLYYVIGAVCSEQGAWRTYFKCQAKGVWVKVIKPDECGDVIINGTTFTYHTDWNTYCQTKFNANYVCDKTEHKCKDMCDGCTGENERCILNSITNVLERRKFYEAHPNTDFCLNKVQACASTKECADSATSWNYYFQSPQTNPVSVDASKNILSWQQGATCDKATPSLQQIKDFNRLNMNNVVGYLGECKKGAVTARDCDAVFGAAYLAKWYDINGGFHTGATWAVGSDGKCILSECSDSCYVTVKDDKSKLVPTRCQIVDARTGAPFTVLADSEHAVGRCVAKDEVVDFLCNSDTDCVKITPAGKVPKCLETSGNFKVCASAFEMASPDTKPIDCTKDDDCLFKMKDSILGCQVAKCVNSYCEIQSSECTQDSDCQTENYKERVCDTATKCCINKDVKPNLCVDGIKNQDEADVDCGGICEVLYGKKCVDDTIVCDYKNDFLKCMWAEKPTTMLLIVFAIVLMVLIVLMMMALGGRKVMS